MMAKIKKEEKTMKKFNWKQYLKKRPDLKKNWNGPIRALLHRALFGYFEKPKVIKTIYIDEKRRNINRNNLIYAFQKATVTNTYYLGVPTNKNPLDYWIYQEIIHDLKPDVIIEIGNKFGGSTLAIAHLLDLNKKGKIIGVDIDQSRILKKVKEHPRIKLIEGDACKSFDKVNKLINKKDKVLIIEDSSHTYDNTLKVLRTYGPMVSKDSYFIVEDTICHHGLEVGPNPGPYEAVEEFMKNNNEFVIDRSKEKFILTFNPKGFLRKRQC